MDKVTQTIKKKNLKSVLKTLVIAGFAVCVIVYALLKTSALTKGITLEIEGIKDGSLIEEAALSISGNARLAKHLLINGREIAINQEGDFKDTLVLLPGYNIITISAEDKFGTITKETFEVVRKEV